MFYELDYWKSDLLVIIILFTYKFVSKGKSSSDIVVTIHKEISNFILNTESKSNYLIIFILAPLTDCP